MSNPLQQNPDSPAESSAWYCVRAQTKREHIAAGQLARLEGVDVFCPRIRFRRKTVRGKVWFEEAMFPGYLFARFDAVRQRAVAGAIGVRGLVQFAGVAAKVPDSLIAVLQAETGGKPVVIPDEPAVKAGDTAVVASGPMQGVRAVVTQVLPGKERVKILMEIMGTAVEAEVPLDMLDKNP